MMKNYLSNSLGWLGGSAAIGALIQIIQLLIISQYFTPYEMGIAAAAMSFVFLIQVYAEMGTANAVIHFDDWNTSKTSTFFFLNVFFSVGLSALLFVFSDKIAVFLGEKELSGMLQVLCLNLLLMPVGRIFQAFAQKNMLYQYIAKVEVFSKVASFFVFSLLVFCYELEAWAIIIASVFSALITLCFYILKKTARPKIALVFNFSSVRKEVNFCIYYLGDTLVSSLNNQLDVIFIGKYLGMEQLGIYSLFKQICVKPYQIINPLAVKIAMPLLSKSKANAALFVKQNFDVLNVFIPILFGIYVVLSFFSEEILSVISREEFIQNEKIFSILAVVCLLRSFISLNGINVIAQGRSGLNFFYSTCVFVILLISLLLSVDVSLEIVVFGLVSSYSFALILNLIVVQKKVTKIKTAQWVGLYGLPFIFVVYTLYCFFYKNTFFNETMNYAFFVLFLIPALKKIVSRFM